ncbi:MAG: radical SAM protein [Verrucomicrobiae bacterium]|jgi:MoaA/NifB/PqqE/SkfB family radical SAM enzyme|nr:radical SAM protein [Verrucomicrobiae bacterium]
MRTLSYLRDVARNHRRAINRPRFLTYIVTWTCNARCIMCDCWKKPSPGDLELPEIENVFSQLGQLDAVRLTGGEPFVRQDFPEIAELVRTRLDPLFLHVTTNGFLTRRIVDFCRSRNRALPLKLLISLDGVDEKHNEVRGRDTAWDTAFATLSELAPLQRELNMTVSVNQTIVDADGPRQYRLLRERLRPLGVNVHIVMAYDASATYSLNDEIDVAPAAAGNFTTFGEFNRDHLEDLVTEFEKDLAHFPLSERVAKRYYLNGIRNRLLKGGNSPNPRCVALNSHLRIFPNGDVPTCQFNSRKVGNLRRQSFEEIWHGTEIAGQRDWVARCPGCWAECEVLPNAVYTGDLLRETLFPGGRRAGEFD